MAQPRDSKGRWTKARVLAYFNGGIIGGRQYDRYQAALAQQRSKPKSAGTARAKQGKRIAR